VIITKADQTIVFDTIPDKKYNDANFSLTAVVDSELEISFESSNPSVIEVFDIDSARITGVGDVSILVIQAGNDNYLPVEISRQLSVTKADQQITFDPIDDQTESTPSIELTATSLSGLKLSYILEVSDSSARLNADSTKIVDLSPGRISITALQSGNEFYHKADSIVRSFCVNPEAEITQSDTMDSVVLISSHILGNSWWYMDSLLDTIPEITVFEDGEYTLEVEIYGCSTTTSTPVNIVLAIGEELGSLNNIKIYPNPVSELLSIDVSRLLGKKIHLQVFNIQGTLLKEVDFIANELIQFETNRLSRGTYVILLSFDQIHLPLHFVKE